jgi:GT2 family glycosyltransferase
MGAIAVIVIGRNEGERLRRCLRSVVGAGRTVVYVDSDSRDGSPALAQSLGAQVVALDMSAPFSAARARNRGIERLLEIEPSTELVQFVDGDCEMIADWFDVAPRAMKEQPQLAAVCGRLRERSPQQSIYNRLADLEWDTPVGLVQSCGGIAMMRSIFFQQVGGFDPTVVAGEEPELCQRFRERGWTILRLADDMALHDSAMLRFAHWWKRCVRSGYGAMDVATRFRSKKEALFVRQIRRSRAWGIGLPVMIVLVSCIVAGIIGWKWGLVAAFALAMLWPLEALRLALKIRGRVRSGADAISYGVFTVISRWANVLGQYRYLRDRAAGKNLQLIEYKTPQRRLREDQELSDASVPPVSAP